MPNEVSSVPSVVAVYWAAHEGNATDWWPAAFPALRTIVMGGLGALAGAQVAMVAIRESHLFRYFKNR